MIESKVDTLFSNFEDTIKEILGMALAEDGKFTKLDPKIAILITKGYNCYVDLANTSREIAKETDAHNRILNEKLDAIAESIEKLDKKVDRASKNESETINDIRGKFTYLWSLRDGIDDPDISEKKRAELRKRLEEKKAELDELLSR